METIQIAVASPSDEMLLVTRDIAVTQRTWVRNDAGTATIVVATNHPKLTTICGEGNILRIRQYGIPTWVGQVVTRDWTDGQMTLGLRSAEYLLKGKRTGQGRVYGAKDATTVGAVAADLFQNAAVVNNPVRNLQPGSFQCATATFRQYTYADLFEALKGLAEDYGADFWVDDRLRAHFMQQRGADLRNDVVLREGRHLSGVRVTEDFAEIATAVIALGEGSDVVEKPKLLNRLPSTRFFRADVLDVQKATTVDGLVEPVNQFFASRGQPRVVVDATVGKITGSYGGFWVGDTVRLVTRHPFLRTLVARVNGIELGQAETLRAVFEVVPTTTLSSAVRWDII